MITDHELERAVRLWLAGGSEQLPDVFLDAALEEISVTPQRRSAWPVSRFPEMNTFARYGLVAAVVLVAIVGFALLANRGPSVGPSPSASLNPSSVATTGTIAFTSGRDTEPNGEIYLVNPDGSGLSRLTNNTFDDFFPAVAPGSQKIAYSSDHGSGRQVYVVNADGSGETALGSPSSASLWGLDWSRDGTRIAFTDDRTGPAQVYVLNADGSDEVKLTAFGEGNSDPTWSPDGSKIAFASLAANGATDIYVMNADGSGAAVVLHADGTVYGEPAWSPDGQLIAFSGPAGGHTEIFVINVDGSGITQLTSDATHVSTQPVWSPDGGRIAYTRFTVDPLPNGGPGEIWVMHADGSGQLPVNADPGNNWGPSWN